MGTLRFSDAEIAALKLAAKRQHLSVGAFIATAALVVAREQLVPVPLTEREQLVEFVQSRVALNRIGNNLNQAVKVLNSGEEAPELLAVLARVARAVQRVELAADAVNGIGRRR